LLALGLSIALFALWLVVGLAVLSALRPSGHLVGIVLLAPAIGLAVVLLCVFLASRGGIPLGVAALPLAALPLVAALATLWRTRPSLPFRQYAPFVIVLLVALLATGRPMLEFGFDWVSYSNDDMANYTLAAQRIVTHGFFDIPGAAELVTGQDYSLAYWFFNLGVRPGAEMLTAWVSGLTRLSPHQTFMPLILALHLVLISAASGLALRGPRPLLAAFLTCCLLAVSAMTALGALYQLIGQVGGLALLVGCVTVLMRPFTGLDRAALVRHGVLLAIVGAGLFVMYPEVVPFLGLSWLLFVGLSLARRRERLLSLAPVLGVAIVAGALLLNSYTLISLAFLSTQATAGMAHADLETLLFPYFLVPSGLASLWGFQNLVQLPNEPWLSTSIGAGAVLLIVSFVAAIRGSWRLQPAAVVALVMCSFGLNLFFQRGDFGLFKLAMFVQPFLLPTLVVGWLGVSRLRVVQVAPLLAMGIAGLYGQIGYVERSRGLLEGTGGGLTEIPNASAARINSEFQQILASIGPREVVLDTSNVVLAKFQALYLIGRPSTFTTQDFFYNIANADPGLQLFNPNIGVAARELRAARNQRFANLSFDLHDPDQPGVVNAFVADVLGQPPQADPARSTLIEMSGKQTVLNRWSEADSNAPQGDFIARPWDQVANHLLFISSLLGQPYYTADRRHVALYQLEPDLFYPGQSMSGLGRHFLFQVVNPSPTVRLVVDMTASLTSDGENQLPPAVAIGADRRAIPFVGRGSARVVSPPLRPQVIDGRSYVSLDMGTDGQRFPMAQVGLMRLFGNDIPMDRRRLVGFGRGISVISDDEYARLSAPMALGSFPGALNNPQLEYSGIYEDGWISDSAYVQLAQPSSASTFALRGSLPLLSSPSETTQVQVLVDGRELLRQAINPGEFQLVVPAPGGGGRRRIELHFDRLIRLGAPDNRPAAVRLTFLGFEQAGTTATSSQTVAEAADVVSSASGIRLGTGWYPFETWAGQSFRWVGSDAEIVVDRPPSAACTLNLDVEPGPGVGSGSFTLHVYDSTGALLTSSVVAGRGTLVLPEQSATPARLLKLHVDGGGLAAPGDPRILNFRVFDASCAEDLPASPVLLSRLNTEADITAPTLRQTLVQGQLPSDGVVLGRGWYGAESTNESIFRWVANDAQLVLTSPTGSERQIELDIEPGPGVGSRPFILHVLDAEGKPVTTVPVQGREVVHATLPVQPGVSGVFRLHVEGGGQPTANDPRTLNFRIFKVR
jgi:hypothetical protein